MKNVNHRLYLVLFSAFVGSEFQAYSFLFTLSFQSRWNGGTLHQRSSTMSTSYRASSREPQQESLHQSEISTRKEEHIAKVVVTFFQNVDESIQQGTFASLTLRGVKRKPSCDPSDLRGSIREVQGRLIHVSNQDMLQLTFKYHGATDICKNYSTNKIVDTLPTLILDPLASEWGEQAVRAQPIQGAFLTTTLNQSWDLRLDKKNAILRQQKAGTKDNGSMGSTIVAAPNVGRPASHDRIKQVPISHRESFLQSLGVTKEDGQPRPGMASKLRQCQKFVEIVGGLVEKTLRGSSKEGPITVLDMGCGRGYLTFALHSYLSKLYGNVSTTGIDVRPKLVAEISGIARKLGDPFDSLKFEEGTIEGVVAQSSLLAANQHSESDHGNDSSFDILVALHACDTATDDALYSGIARGADLIVVAPCCHKEVRHQLDVHHSANRMVHPMADILKHAVYRERMTETVTDSLRALLLEYVGYKVQVFEFIGGEHTSKNVMITAIKMRRSSSKTDPNLLTKIESLASLYGISHQKLVQSLKIDLTGGFPDKRAEEIQTLTNRMPPLRRKNS